MGGSSPRRPIILKTLRDLAIRALMLTPLWTRLWVMAQCTRPLLWLLFHLEKDPMTIAPVGPGFCRYRMGVN